MYRLMNREDRFLRDKRCKRDKREKRDKRDKRDKAVPRHTGKQKNLF